MEIAALHGNLGTAHDWETLGIDGLRAIDLWEHTSLSYFEFAHELATELTSGMDRPVLAGYSLGGRLALYAMAIHPERWAGAVIISAHPGLCCVEDRLARRVSDEIWAERARTMPWQAFLESWDAQGVLSGSTSPEKRLELEYCRESVALAFETWTLGRQEDLRNSLRSFHAPVLWITGAEDRKFSDLAVEMKDVFESLEHWEIPDCGHRVLLEQPDAVAARISSFSEEIESRSNSG